MFFNSIKEIKAFRKEINKLLSKGMSDIYLKVATEKKTDVLQKNLPPGQFLSPAPAHANIIEF